MGEMIKFSLYDKMVDTIRGDVYCREDVFHRYKATF